MPYVKAQQNEFPGRPQGLPLRDAKGGRPDTYQSDIYRHRKISSGSPSLTSHYAAFPAEDDAQTE